MKTGLFCMAMGIGLSACGSEAVSVDPGDGTGDLLVEAHVDLRGNDAEMRVDVQRAGQVLADARVNVRNGALDVPLSYLDGGEYRAATVTDDDYFTLEVIAGDSWLEGGIEAPDRPVLLSPDPLAVLDASAATGGVVELVWDGDVAQRVRVKVGDFEWEGLDEGALAVPIGYFDDDTLEIDIERSNETMLVGGAPGSELRVSHEHELELIVVNPISD